MTPGDTSLCPEPWDLIIFFINLAQIATNVITGYKLVLFKSNNAVHNWITFCGSECTGWLYTAYNSTFLFFFLTCSPSISSYPYSYTRGQKNGLNLKLSINMTVNRNVSFLWFTELCKSQFTNASTTARDSIKIFMIPESNSSLRTK